METCDNYEQCIFNRTPLSHSFFFVFKGFLKKMKSSRFGNRLSGSVGRIPISTGANTSRITQTSAALVVAGSSSSTDVSRMVCQSRTYIDVGIPSSSSRDDSNYQSPRQSWKPHDWSCPSCNSHNFAKRTNCFSCGTAAPPTHEQPSERKNRERTNESREGEWVCGSCSACNFAFRLMCYVCSRPRPASATILKKAEGAAFSRPGGGLQYKQQYHEVIRVGEAPGGKDPSRRPSAERLDLTRTTAIASPQELSGQLPTQHTRTVIQAVKLDEDATPVTEEDQADQPATTKKGKKKKKIVSKGKKKSVSESELDSLLSGGATASTSPVIDNVPQEIIPSSAKGAQTSFFSNMEDEPESINENFYTTKINVSSPGNRQINSQKDTGSLKPGDWLCPRCRSHNFASRHVCFQCSGARPSFLHLTNTSKAQEGKLSVEELVFSKHIQGQGKRATEVGEDGTLFACNNGAGRGHMNRRQHNFNGSLEMHDVEGTPLYPNSISGTPASAIDVRANHERSIIDRIAQFDTSDILSPEILERTEKRDKALIFGTLRGKLLFGDKKFPDLPFDGMSPEENANQQLIKKGVVIDAFKVGDWRCAGCGFHNFSVRTTCKSCMTHQNTFPALEPFPTGDVTPAETNHDAEGLFTIIHNEEDGKLYVREIARRVGEFATLRLVLTGRINITLKKKKEQLPTAKKYNNGNMADGSSGPSNRHSNDSAPAQHSSAKPMRGDWWCDKCQFLNFAARLSCKNCHARRSSTVKVHLGKVSTTTNETLTTPSGTVYTPNPLLTPADQQMREEFRKERGLSSHPPGEVGNQKDKNKSNNLQSMVVSLDSLLDDVLGDGDDN